MTSEILSYIYYLVHIILDIFSAFKSSQKKKQYDDIGQKVKW